MPVETGTTLAELDESWPLSNDVLIEGDNHLRLIKSILKDQFPGELGDGLAAVISATELELNYLVGVTSSIQDQIDNLALSRVPVGHLLFTINTENPNTYGYPGVWVLLTAGSSFNTVDDVDVDLGLVTGDDDQIVPVPEHLHLMDDGIHEATFVGDPHSHTMDFSSQTYFLGSTSNPVYYNGGSSSTNETTAEGTVTLDLGETDNAGTLDATVNVKGVVYNLLCWERVS